MVQAIILAAHGLHDLSIFVQFSILYTCLMVAPVGVMGQPGNRVFAVQGHR